MILGVTTSATLSMKLLAGNLKVLLKDIPDGTKVSSSNLPFVP
jgi:hypothetical protein